ncbi:hypothetical protein DOTSEDRAFT_74199 [Dothistroma septosporum NZE10]|uniref:Uncharacterized protein n=1 Tax=Dothistroma septosporum (strain NZE10 / CBS 128990) TaxID=675120 RepID=N1PD87_DOTSN|nr:hypothetical protein DOTSEDRAFT_74199 [Dothistroma septosporum NZE10]
MFSSVCCSGNVRQLADSISRIRISTCTSNMHMMGRSVRLRAEHGLSVDYRHDTGRNRTPGDRTDQWTFTMIRNPFGDERHRFKHRVFPFTRFRT